MSYLGSIRPQLQKVYQIQEETSNRKIHDQLVSAGMGKTSKASEPRVANPNKISEFRSYGNNQFNRCWLCL